MSKRFCRCLQLVIASSAVVLLHAFIWDASARAQTEGLQDLQDLTFPDPPAIEPPSKTTIVKRTVPAQYKIETITLGRPEVISELTKTGEISIQSLNKLDDGALAAEMKAQGKAITYQMQGPGKPIKFEIRSLVAPAQDFFDEQTKVDPPTLTLSLPTVSGNFTSNAASSSTNEVADRNVVLAPTLSFKLPVSAKDAFQIDAQSISTRYDRTKALDSDVLRGNFQFAHFFDDAQGLGRFFDGVQKENVTIGLESRSRYAPGYAGDAKTLLTPSLVWAITGIPVGTMKCAEKQCFTFGLSAIVDYTRSYYDQGDNISTAGSATLVWNPGPKGLSLSAKAQLRYRGYEQLPTDRDDLVGNYSVAMKWQYEQATVQAQLEYGRRDSSITSSDYEVYQAQPRLQLDIPLY